MQGPKPTPFFTTCDQCEQPFEPETSYPVVTAEEEGRVEVYSFCDEACRDAWESDPPNA